MRNPTGVHNSRCTDVDDRPGALPGEQFRRERDREQLIRANRRIVAVRSVEDVETAAAVLVPEPLERLAHARGRFFERVRIGIAVFGELRRGVERREPQRVDLDRLSDARRHDVIADLGIHPRQLHARNAGAQETVGRIDADAEPRSFRITGNDRAQHAETCRARTADRAVAVAQARIASTYQSAASTVLYSGALPASGKTLGSIPPSTNGAKPRTIASATSTRRLAMSKPGSAIIVSRPQSLNHG